MINDCHLHTSFSGDCDAAPESQIERAIALGMTEMAITDHHDINSSFCTECFVLDLPDYIRALNGLKEHYSGRIRLNIGIELGLEMRNREYLSWFYTHFHDSFDFIIGSNHYIWHADPYFPQFWQEHGENAALEKYFERSLERTKCFLSCFDSLGHLDYALRYAPCGDKALSSAFLDHYITPTLKTLIDAGKALECNTGGLRSRLKRTNPGRDIFTLYRALGGELVTIGSDAHDPKDLGSGFEEARQMLLGCGYRYYTVFRSHKPYMLPL